MSRKKKVDAYNQNLEKLKENPEGCKDGKLVNEKN